MLILVPLYDTDTFLDTIVIPLSRSKSLLSMINSPVGRSLSLTTFPASIILSTNVVLPWSTCAIIAMFLISILLIMNVGKV